MSRYAEGSTVTPEQSRSEIERTLGRFGADQFGYMQKADAVAILFRARGKAIRIVVKLPPLASFRQTRGTRNRAGIRRTEQASRNAQEREVKRRWRSLALMVKAKLEAVSSGITTFEEEFLAHIVLQGGTTVGDWAIPQLERLSATELENLPALGAGADEDQEDGVPRSARRVNAEVSRE